MYSKKELEILRSRWDNHLIKHDSFNRDNNGNVIIRDKVRGNFEIDIDGCSTFSELLNNRLGYIDDQLNNYYEKNNTEGEINKLQNNSVSGIGEIEGRQDLKETTNIILIRDKYSEIWRKIAEDIFIKTMEELYNYGLPEIYRIEISNIRGKPIKIDLRGASCNQKCFIGADLNNAHFEGAFCIKSNFSYSSLSSAHFDNAKCGQSLFTGAWCNSATFYKADLIYVNFCCAHCMGTNFKNVTGNNICFTNTDCRHAEFDGGNFEEAILKKVNFKGATFNGSKFLGVDISNTDWSKNPRLKRFIEQQQYVNSVKEKFNNWRGFKYLPCFIISALDWFSDILRLIFISIIIIIGFSITFVLHANEFLYESIPEATSWLYFSVVTFSTLGFGDVTPLTSTTHILVIFEVLFGYIILGAFITFLANWIGRK